MHTPWLIKELLCAIYPPHCRVCGRHTRDSILCRRCVPPLEVIHDYWEISDQGSKSFPHTFLIRVISLHQYRGVVRRLIKRIKFAPDKALLKAWLAHLLTKPSLLIELPSVESVTWVPSHRENHLRRDFDPSEIVARGLTQYWDLPSVRPLLLRDAQLSAQSHLMRAARIKNAASLFRVGRKNIPQRVLLVDDVISTGASVRGAAKALHDGGAHEITVLSLARNLR